MRYMNQEEQKEISNLVSDIKGMFRSNEEYRIFKDYFKIIPLIYKSDLMVDNITEGLNCAYELTKKYIKLIENKIILY